MSGRVECCLPGGLAPRRPSKTFMPPGSLGAMSQAMAYWTGNQAVGDAGEGMLDHLAWIGPSTSSGLWQARKTQHEPQQHLASVWACVFCVSELGYREHGEASCVKALELRGEAWNALGSLRQCSSLRISRLLESSRRGTWLPPDACLNRVCCGRCLQGSASSRWALHVWWKDYSDAPDRCR